MLIRHRCLTSETKTYPAIPFLFEWTVGVAWPNSSARSQFPPCVAACRPRDQFVRAQIVESSLSLPLSRSTIRKDDWTRTNSFRSLQGRLATSCASCKAAYQPCYFIREHSMMARRCMYVKKKRRMSVGAGKQVLKAKLRRRTSERSGDA